ncbi:MAG TPA: 4Fe-4S binding protein [Bacteroidales bacterium]|nr:4Fe-4S binding protein [Bacteroidales bacterium]
MTTPQYIHAIQIDTEICIGCSHCMRVCSTQAIRIVDGHASISPERCVDCGECYRVCPMEAIYVKDDRLAKGSKDYIYKIALVPAVFFGQFPVKYSVTQISDAIRELGFNEVFEVEQAVDFIKSEYKRIAKDKDIVRPVISSFCPSVVRLIQVMFPSLTENILQLKPPHDIAAIYLREINSTTNIRPEEIGIYYFTPCAAKIVAAKAPEGEDESPIDVVVSMRELYNKVYKLLIENKSDKDDLKRRSSMTSDSIKWSLSGTEREYFRGRSLAIDGVENVIQFLEILESGRISDIDFLELRVCDQGCAGGIVCPGNRFLAVERIGERQKRLQERLKENKKVLNPLMEYAKELQKVSKVKEITPRKGLLLDENVEIALQKMAKIKTLNSYLPGFDCGACGAPTCKNLAEDIVKGNASMSYCIFVQRIMEKNYKLSPEQAFLTIEKIWGKNRLNKYKDNYGEKEVE